MSLQAIDVNSNKNITNENTIKTIEVNSVFLGVFLTFKEDTKNKLFNLFCFSIKFHGATSVSSL